MLARERARGRADALDLAGRAPDLDGTAIIAEEDHIPAWSETAVYTADMIGWPVQDDGHVWRSTFDGSNVWRPSEYPAGWEDLGTVEEVQGA